MTQTKPSIVFCHGLWADGSCFSKLIVPLHADGYECIAAQYGLNSTAEDVALTTAASAKSLPRPEQARRRQGRTHLVASGRHR
jgi:hypothetical protein